MYIKKSSREDFAPRSKLWAANSSKHLPIFAGHSRSTGISQLPAGRQNTVEKGPQQKGVCSPMYNGLFTFYGQLEAKE